jgi:hypothetical protein
MKPSRVWLASLPLRMTGVGCALKHRLDSDFSETLGIPLTMRRDSRPVRAVGAIVETVTSIPSDRRCTMREEFASYGFLSSTGTEDKSRLARRSNSLLPAIRISINRFNSGEAPRQQSNRSRSYSEWEPLRIVPHDDDSIR